MLARTGDLRAPVLYVLGGRSTIVSAEAQQALTKTLPRAEIVTIPGVGHYPSDERPAEVLAIVAANEVDMHMSGEIRYSGRTDVIALAVVTQIAHVCAALGVAGLHRSLLRAQARETPVPREYQTGLRASYRISPDRRSPVAMATNVRAVLP